MKLIALFFALFGFSALAMNEDAPPTNNSIVISDTIDLANQLVNFKKQSNHSDNEYREFLDSSKNKLICFGVDLLKFSTIDISNEKVFWQFFIAVLDIFKYISDSSDLVTEEDFEILFSTYSLIEKNTIVLLWENNRKKLLDSLKEHAERRILQKKTFEIVKHRDFFYDDHYDHLKHTENPMDLATVIINAIYYTNEIFIYPGFIDEPLYENLINDANKLYEIIKNHNLLTLSNQSMDYLASSMIVIIKKTMENSNYIKMKMKNKKIVDWTATDCDTYIQSITNEEQNTLKKGDLIKYWQMKMVKNMASFFKDYIKSLEGEKEHVVVKKMTPKQSEKKTPPKKSSKPKNKKKNTPSKLPTTKAQDPSKTTENKTENEPTKHQKKLDSNNKKLKEENEEFREENETLLNKLQNLGLENNTLNKICLNSEQEKTILNKEVRRKNNRIHNLNVEIEKKNKRIERLENILKSLPSPQNAAQSTHHNYQKDLLEKEDEIKNQKEENKFLLAKVENLETKLSEQINRSHEKRIIHFDNQDKISELKEQNRNINNQIWYREKEYTNITKNLIEYNTNLEKENSEIKLATNKLSEKIYYLNHDIQERDDYILYLEKELEQLQLKQELPKHESSFEDKQN